MSLASSPPPGSPSALREANARRILAVLRTAQRRGAAGLSQAQLARRTDLAPATVSGIVRGLASAGVLDVEQGAGRRGATVRIGRGAGLAAGVNFGHTHLAVMIGDLAGDVLASRREKLSPDHLAQDGLRRARVLLDECLEEVGASRDEVRHTGVGVPAPLCKGVVQSPGIFPGWVGLDAAAIAHDLLGGPVTADNDANLAALAEFRRGDLPVDGSLVFLKVASGVGAGLVMGGELHRGMSGMAGEIGHVTVDEGGPYCRCGNRGCLEAYVSVTHVLDVLHGTMPGATFADVIEEAHGGHPAALRALEDVGHRLGYALAGVVNLLAPGAVVLGGEMSGAGELLLAPLRTTLRRHCLDAVASDTVVSMTPLGDEASLIGALDVARDQADLVAGLEL
jgi:predicted NBD/HSP70 family sugar kinase